MSETSAALVGVTVGLFGTLVATTLGLIALRQRARLTIHGGHLRVGPRA